MRVKQHIKEYKRALILENALELFSEKGFQKTTIDDIGGSLGVTKPFIYTYFDSKYAILEQLYDRAYRDLHAGILEILNSEEGGPTDRLRRAVRLYVEQNIERQKLTAIMLEEERNLSPRKRAEVRRKHREFDASLTRLIEAGVAAGEFRVADPKLASLAISGIVRWMHRWYSPEGRLSPSELAERLSAMALGLVGCSADLPALGPGFDGRRQRRAVAAK